MRIDDKLLMGKLTRDIVVSTVSDMLFGKDLPGMDPIVSRSIAGLPALHLTEISGENPDEMDSTQQGWERFLEEANRRIDFQVSMELTLGDTTERVPLGGVNSLSGQERRGFFAHFADSQGRPKKSDQMFMADSLVDMGHYNLSALGAGLSAIHLYTSTNRSTDSVPPFHLMVYLLRRLDGEDLHPVDRMRVALRVIEQIEDQKNSRPFMVRAVEVGQDRDLVGHLDTALVGYRAGLSRDEILQTLDTPDGWKIAWGS